ncbi:hypothetical protein AK830_g8844 [Neonectria ditissima]|uniref:Uncharacterized protein n=1 Tax=Neonectria ditissima TaxID=78410 RepID=A0A0P7BB98_9HYPO|nr:hypothetical protein AK830_g8844 [Neonectria ditissima]
MAARLVSPPGQSRGYSPSPIGQAHAQTHTHTQTHTQAQAQSEAAIARHRHRQPLHPLPLSRPGTSSTLSRPRRPHSSTITTTTTTSTTTTTTAAASTNALPNISTPPRRRPTSTAPPPQSWHAQPVHLWPTDDHDLLNLADPFGTSQPGNALVDDPYLAAFAEADFSSPSSYPSFTEPDAHLSQSHAQTRPPPVPQDSRPLPSAPSPSATAAPRDPSGACSLDLNCTAAQRSTTQLSSTTAGESQSTWPTLDSFDFADSDLFDSPASSFSDNMPQTRRRPPPTAPPHEVVHASKRRRTSTNVSNQTPTKSPSSRRKHQPHANKDVDDSLFESNQPPPHLDVDAPSSDFTTIDLTEANEVPEDLKKPVEDNRIKLVAFQCVICMDDVTTLTVTHCGMFSLFVLTPGNQLPATSVCASSSHTNHRSSLLRPVPAFFFARRGNQGEVPHVPPEAGHEA